MSITPKDPRCHSRAYQSIPADCTGLDCTDPDRQHPNQPPSDHIAAGTGAGTDIDTGAGTSTDAGASTYADIGAGDSTGASTGTGPETDPIYLPYLPEITPWRKVLRPQPALYVAIGGSLGGICRVGLDHLAHLYPAHYLLVSWSTILANLLGAFLLGLLVSYLARWRRAQPQAGTDRLRLLLGTGFLGAFTTYSSFALALALTLATDPFLTIFEGATTVALGLVLAGIAFLWGNHLPLPARISQLLPGEQRGETGSGLTNKNSGFPNHKGKTS